MRSMRPLALAGLLVLPGSSLVAQTRALEERCRIEIIELHEFLQQWSNAALPATDDAFRRFARAIGPSFVIIGTDGVAASREEVVEAIRGAHGRWREDPGRIRIENVLLRQVDGEIALATYEEWHEFGGVSRGRSSSVLFGSDAEAPNGLVWLHLHETWLE